MKPEDTLPAKLVALADPSLLVHLIQARPLTRFGVISAEGVGRIMGYPWWRALTETLEVPCLFDADDAPALAASALRQGADWVVCTGPAPAIATLRETARVCGGHVLTTRPDALTLGRPPYNAYRIGQLHTYLAS
ncbi:hypothetical protein [Asaia krungthepensis]|uniref:Uncharacterized protein n=1 Tax=Asaia krungthepensis NRIC 0535 TaxID=1307925 RepID=A0ABQ0PW33_9PROT|nr:hypothetical protein [Asaia krungthepensis]GBQ83040.1 hypothetical protein AA0535_0145 [Asaia krungthepensis NRIC 0535]